jgi:hypothetical protein
MKGAGGQSDAIELCTRCLDDPGVSVPLIQGRIGRKHIEVSLPLDIPHPYTFSPIEHNGKGLVIVRAPELGFLDERLCTAGSLL